MKRELRTRHKSRTLPVNRGGTGTNESTDIAKSLNVVARDEPTIIELDAEGHIKDANLITSILSTSTAIKAGFHLKRTLNNKPRTGLAADAGEVCVFEITDYDSAYAYTAAALKGETITAVDPLTKTFTYTAPATAPGTGYGFKLTKKLQADPTKTDFRDVDLIITASSS